MEPIKIIKAERCRVADRGICYTLLFSENEMEDMTPAEIRNKFMRSEIEVNGKVRSVRGVEMYAVGADVLISKISLLV